VLWLFAAIHPVYLQSSPSRAELYRLAVSLLAPAAGLVLTAVAAQKLARMARNSRPVRWPPLALASAFTLVAATLIAFLVLERAPHIPDEITYLFDARTFAAGQRVSAPPPVPDAFPAPEWIEIEAGRAYGVFPPGWPLILSLGVLAGAPWLTNALLGAIAILLIARLGRRTSGTGTGNGASPPAAWLAAMSPFLLFLTASYMAHPAALLWTTLALTSYLSLACERPGLGSGLVLAIAAAFLFLTRPIEALALLIAIMADVLRSGRSSLAAGSPPSRSSRSSRSRAGVALLVLAAGLAVGTAATLADNARLTGAPLVPPVNRYFDTQVGPGSNRLGFGSDIGHTWDASPPGHTPLEATWNLCLNLAHLNRHLLGWPAGSLVLVLIFLLGARKTRGERLLLFHAAATLLLYSLYWYHGVAFGPRFLTSLIPGLVLFTWRGANLLASWLATQHPEEDWERWVRLGVAFSIACAIGLYVPVKAVAEYRGLRGIDGVLLRQAEAAATPALIFVEGPRAPDYTGLYFLNAPDYRGPRVVALSRGPAGDQEVAAAYPGRTPRILTRHSGVRDEGGRH
jgi:hypothetical protein